ncbi:outer membrane beta-barrel protein [uncultured Desulfobacter sp.]|uniref:outer membrane beta-barrel protein n=1 Tax=uncultured Desulfobacter sp. TaxID=240139 RepID=UPI0029F5C924|nr:outer membrane beta-barrel protein [uncultured Desulfobacter sp.]
MKKCLALIIMLVFWSCAASADPDTITPFISLNQQYSDNILFVDDQPEADWITAVEGGLTLKRKTERLDTSLTGRLKQRWYADNSELDALDRSASGGIDYRLNERFSLGGTADYSKDSTRDRDTDTTGLKISGDREKFGFSVSSNYFVSEKTKAGLEVRYGNTQEDEDDEQEDNDLFSVTVSLSKNLSETFKNTTGLLNLSYFRYTADIDHQYPDQLINGLLVGRDTLQEYTSDTFQFSAGFSRQMTEIVDIFCLAGASFSQTDEKTNTRYVHTQTSTVISSGSVEDENGGVWGGVISTGVNYNGLKSTMGLALSQDMRGASGTNGVVQRTSLSGKVRHRITEDLTLSLRASCYLNENERTNQDDTDDLTFNVQPGFRYRFTQTLFLTGYYRYTHLDDRIEDTQTERNLFSLTLKKEF